VGNTCLVPPCREVFTVHPHVRGEHRGDLGDSPFNRGSSPRAWGTRVVAEDDELVRRFIPTCVGNTWRRGRRARAASVHPHVRGEHDPWTATAITVRGSSPRAWGTRVQGAVRAGDERFIPTCVGNTEEWGVRNLNGAVHPHVRGEHGSEVQIITAKHGSSPRAWGTPRHENERRDKTRFIPTCVGNTSG